MNKLPIELIANILTAWTNVTKHPYSLLLCCKDYLNLQSEYFKKLGCTDQKSRDFMQFLSKIVTNKECEEKIKSYYSHNMTITHFNMSNPIYSSYTTDLLEFMGIHSNYSHFNSHLKHHSRWLLISYILYHNPTEYSIYLNYRKFIKKLSCIAARPDTIIDHHLTLKCIQQDNRLSLHTMNGIANYFVNVLNELYVLIGAERSCSVQYVAMSAYSAPKTAISIGIANKL